MPRNPDPQQPRRFVGTFTLAGRPTTGELRLKGVNTRLELHDADFIAPLAIGAHLHGVARNREHLTLIDCRSPGVGSTTRSDGTATSYHAEVFPHYVAIGRAHIDPDQPCVRCIDFTCTDLPTLFYDFDAFSKVINAKPIIDAVLKERRELRPVEAGERPIVCYFTGRDGIADVQTVIGRLTVRHSPSYTLGSPTGVRIDNRIMVSLEPEAPVTFSEAVDRMYIVANFLSVAAGRSQGIEHVGIVSTAGTAEAPEWLDVHVSYRWKAYTTVEHLTPHPRDVPLDPIHRPDEFSTVVADWIRRHHRWRIARGRYLDCLRKDNTYEAERLVAAANMFDILPSEALPTPAPLSDALAATKENCEKLFRAHPPGIERNRALSDLGRLGQPSLPKKVAHRVAIIEAKLPTRFPDLLYVATIATKCRNFYVHGSDEDGVHGKVEHLVPFLTDALEFIFAASDFIEAGWDAPRWNAEGHSWGHTFARFRWGYMESVAELRRVLPPKKRSAA